MSQAKMKPPRPPHPRTVPAIAARLRAFQDSQKLSQAEICRRAEIAPNTYNQWIRAKGRPELDKAIKLCDAFRLTLDWVYLGDAACLPNHIASKLPPDML